MEPGNEISQNRPATMGIDLDELYNSSRQCVMVVEDEPDTVSLIKQILRSAGFNVIGAYSGEESLKKCAELRPDLVLLDIMMPDMDGWETFRHLRQISDIPVIIISALGSKDQVVQGLQMGVDDYITKPFVNAEVVARVKAVLRRSTTSRQVDRAVFPKVDLLVNFQTQEVTFKSQSIQLTNKEFAILTVLVHSAPGVVNYQTIAQQVWGEDNTDVRNRIKYLVYLMRRKFQAVDPARELIVNVDRLGYKLQTEA